MKSIVLRSLTLLALASPTAAQGACSVPPKGSVVALAPADAEALVTLLYDGLLFRAPDTQGLNHHKMGVVRYGFDGLVSVASAMGASDEFRLRVLANHSREDVLNHAFQTFFGHAPGSLEPYDQYIKEGDAACALARLVWSDEFVEKRILPLLVPRL